MNIDTILRSVVAVRATIPEDAFTADAAGHPPGGQRRRHPRRRAGAHHRLSDHRGRGGLADRPRTGASFRRMRSPTTRKPASAWCRRCRRSACRRWISATPRKAKVGDAVVLADGIGQQVRGEHRHQAGIRRLLGISAGRGDLHRAGPSVVGRRRTGRRGRQAARHRLAAPADEPRAARSPTSTWSCRSTSCRRSSTTCSTRGQVDKPPRPWLGAFSAESNGDVVVMSVAEGGPAAKAGLRQGDIISDVRDGEVDGLADFYRKLWESGPAGAEMPHAGRARRPRNMAARQVGRPQQLSEEAATAVRLTPHKPKTPCPCSTRRTG